MVSKKRYIIGIDLGGTKIAAALADTNGKILKQIIIPTEAEKGQKHVIGNIIKLIQQFGFRPDRIGTEFGIGISVPGPVIYEKGIIVSPPNLPGWKRVNLKRILEKKFKTKVFLDNDAKCAALAEARLGTGKNIKNFVYVTLSTGVGGGIIIDGKLYRGIDGMAGEVGHMPIDKNGPKCGCGLHGDLESLGSGRAFKPDAISVKKAARAGEDWAIKEIDKTAQNIGLGFAGIVNILNPEAIIIGGGLSNMGELLLSPVRKYVKQYALPLPAKSVKILKAKLGPLSSLYGAILLCT